MTDPSPVDPSPSPWSGRAGWLLGWVLSTAAGGASIVVLCCGIAGYRGDSMDPRCVFGRPGYVHYHFFKDNGRQLTGCRFDPDVLPHSLTRESSPPTTVHPSEPLTRR